MKRLVIASFLAILSAITVSAAGFESSVEETREIEVEELEDDIAPAVVDYVPTSTFSVKIPKAIKLDENGHGNYTVGVKGKISSSTVVKIEPSSTIEMESLSGGGSSVKAKVTPGKELWKYDEVKEYEWSEDSTGEIQMEKVSLTRLRGSLSFDISFLPSKTYKVDYDLDGGENNESNPTSWTQVEGKVELLPATKFQYAFAGWWDGKQQVKELKGLEDDITLTAKWVSVGKAEELNDWEYTLDEMEQAVILYRYKGNSGDVKVEGFYVFSDGTAYRTRLAANLNNFVNNSTTSLIFDDGVDCSNVRDLTSFAEDCRELRNIHFGNNQMKVQTATKAFKGCTSLSTLDLQGISIEGDATEAFADSGLISVYVSQNWKASGEKLYKGSPLDNITMN